MIKRSNKKSESLAGQMEASGEPTPPLTFCVKTLGCKVNQYESESIAQEMVSAGFKKLEKPQGPVKKKPNVCIINTCTVTRKASMQSRQAIRQAIRSNPEAAIVVTGCLAQTAPEEIKKIGGVQYIVGHADKPRIADLASAVKPGCAFQPEIICRDLQDIRTFADMHLPAPGSRTRPFLKIQDGCDAFCTYCIVPFARGRSRSMPMDRVIQHIRDIRKAGYHEIVLTGIHLGRYGADLSPQIDLAHLLNHLCASESIDRIRLSSVEPLELTPALIELAARSGRRPGQLCPHFHIPLQSGDDDILKRMHRPYRQDDFRKRVLHICETLPHAAVGADVLIGFPGETEDAFENTFRLLEELPLAYLHVFPFSPRQGTPAAGYPEHVPQQIIKDRCRRTREMGIQKRKAYLQKWLDQDVEVLVEGSRDVRSGMLRGVTSNYLKVLLDGENRWQNTFQKVHIESLADERTLFGRL